MNIFGKYADYYDHFYSDKNYRQECDMLINLFKKFSSQSIKTILDLGCGTGNHAFILKDMGFEVTGLDRSKSMLKNAIKKTKNTKKVPPINFIEGDIRHFNLNITFDAAIMMFGVLSYQIKNEDVLNTLKSIRKHLQKERVLIFDTWFGPGVLHNKPSDRLKIIEGKSEQIIRFANSNLDVINQRCTVNYRTWHIKNKKLVTEVVEHHPMRYFFTQEMELFLKITNYKLLHTGSFPQWNKPPDDTSWNVIWVAQAV